LRPSANKPFPVVSRAGPRRRAVSSARVGYNRRLGKGCELDLRANLARAASMHGRGAHCMRRRGRGTGAGDE
jgi:hypothetical protein